MAYFYMPKSDRIKWKSGTGCPRVHTGVIRSIEVRMLRMPLVWEDGRLFCAIRAENARIAQKKGKQNEKPLSILQ